MFSKIAPLLIVAAFLASTAQSASPDGSPQKTVLLLRNGEVLRGVVAKVGDRYVVTLGNGSELRVTVRDVEMHCLDLEEAYVRKRASMNSSSLDEHLALCDWCLRNSLNRQAADELLQAIAINPHHPKIDWFERRLQSAIAPSTHSTGRASSVSQNVSLEELERTMQGLPPDSVEMFVSRVQPLLLNRCGASTCHGIRSKSDFRLVRPGWGKTVTRRFTQRNLHAAMQVIDPDSPGDSPLLVAPTAAHGSVAGPVFSKREQTQLRVLLDWVNQVTRGRKRQSIAAAPPKASGPLVQASYEEPVHLPQAPADQTQPAPSHAGNSSPATAGSTLVPPVPRDPFDPDVFNRRYGNTGQQQKTPETK